MVDDACAQKMCSDRTKIRVAEALVGDETGCIILNPINGSEMQIISRMWNVLLLIDRYAQTAEQIETVTPGSSIIVRNARIDMVRGHMRLTVDRWGSIEVNPG